MSRKSPQLQRSAAAWSFEGNGIEWQNGGQVIEAQRIERSFVRCDGDIQMRLSTIGGKKRLKPNIVVIGPDHTQFRSKPTARLSYWKERHSLFLRQERSE